MYMYMYMYTITCTFYIYIYIYKIKSKANFCLLSLLQSSGSKQKFAFDLRFRSAYYGIERSIDPCNTCYTFATFILFIYIYIYILYIYLYMDE